MYKKFQALIATEKNNAEVRVFAEQMLCLTENLFIQSKSDDVADLLIAQYIFVGNFFLRDDKPMRAIACFKRALRIFIDFRHRSIGIDAISAKTAYMESTFDANDNRIKFDDTWRFIPPYCGIFLHIEAMLYNQIYRAILQISQSFSPRRTRVIQKLLDKYVALKMQSPESTTFEKIAAIFSEIRVALNFLPEKDKSKLNAFIFDLDLQTNYTCNFYVQNFDELKSAISYETRKALIVLYEAHLHKNPPHWLTD